jgi:hypothetical protein
MKFIPILFSTAMVQAILEGRKTQTRRVCKHQFWSHMELVDVNKNQIIEKVDRNVSCLYGQSGDVLWVRETWLQVMRDHAHDLLEGWRDRDLFIRKTDVHEDWIEYAKEKYGYKWKPSIHMPKSACRIFLEVVSVRVERLRDISQADAIAEGIVTKTEVTGLVMGQKNDYPKSFVGHKSWVLPKESFKGLWKSINGQESWDSNPWVWVVEFKRIEKPENFK